MRQRHCAAALAGLLVLSAAACDSFLTGPGISETQNNPTRLDDPKPLYVAVQTVQATQFEGQLARLAAMYTQQIAGISRQFQGYDIYLSQPTDLDPYWQGVYIGGGLADIRKIQAITQARGDSTFAGIAKVWEALVIGMAASFWGDIPYREALQFTEEQDPTRLKARLDPQLQVYADVHAKLDTAIAFLAASGPSNVGPGGAELIYPGRSASALRTVYTQVAHTLKARFHLHLAEVDPSNYEDAAAHARLGIASPANDFTFYHSTAAPSNNIHYQFYWTRGDVLGGAALINLMKARIAAGKDVATDRLAFYFYDVCYENVEDPDLYFGFRPAANPNLPGGEGAPAGTTCSDGSDIEGAYSDFFMVSSIPEFRQPIITFIENELILAEACLRGASCGLAEAQQAYNDARANETYGKIGSDVVAFRDQPVIPVTLQDVMEEKYIDLFLNPEVWNDYKRTCLPYLAPAPRTITGTQLYDEIAGRVPYGLSEFNTNAANVPNVGSTARNANDPNACPLLGYTGTPAAY